MITHSVNVYFASSFPQFVFKFLKILSYQYYFNWNITNLDYFKLNVNWFKMMSNSICSFLRLTKMPETDKMISYFLIEFSQHPMRQVLLSSLDGWRKWGSMKNKHVQAL
jgi:hypothetical protein